MANIDKVQELRRMTQASYADCMKALSESDNDIKRAEEFLIKYGLRVISEKVSRESSAGVVHSYIHPGNRVGVLVEIRCNTDFVAKTEEFLEFSKNISMQIAAMKPTYVSRAEITENEYVEERGRRFERLVAERALSDKIGNMLDAEMDQWYSEVCLLEQQYVKDGSHIVKELLAKLINKVGENCKISRFVRWEIGLE